MPRRRRAARTVAPPTARRHRAVRVAPYLLAALVLAAVLAPAGARSGVVAADPAGPATAGSLGLRLVDVPAASRDDPRAALYVVDELRPGTVIHRRVEVSNTTGSALHVGLYAAAATVARGSFLGAAGRTPDELSSWTSVLPGESDVPAGGVATPTVTVAVPRDAAAGERYGVVWAEVRSVPTTGGGVVRVSRVGIRLYVLVGSGGASAADFAIDSLTAGRSPGGLPTVLASVRNTGGRALDMTGTLALLGGPGGLTAGPFPVTLGTTVGIGQEQPVSIPLDSRLPSGPWDARITLRSGVLDRTARATILFPATGSARPVTARAPGRDGWRYPGVAGVLLLAVAAVIALVRRHRRRTGGPVPAHAPGPSRAP